MSKRKPRAGIKRGACAWYHGEPVRVVCTHRDGTSDISYPIWSASTWWREYPVLVSTWKIRLVPQLVVM
jgi:hypothetical protein